MEFLRTWFCALPPKKKYKIEETDRLYILPMLELMSIITAQQARED